MPRLGLGANWLCGDPFGSCLLQLPTFLVLHARLAGGANHTNFGALPWEPLASLPILEEMLLASLSLSFWSMLGRVGAQSPLDA